MRDRWGHDRDTGARGLAIGLRVVKNGKVKIGKETWRPRFGSLAAYEGKRIEVRCYNALATEYAAYDPVSGRDIGMLVTS